MVIEDVEMPTQHNLLFSEFILGRVLTLCEAE